MRTMVYSSPLFSTKTHCLCAQKKRLDETPLLSKQTYFCSENSNTTPIRTNFSPKRMLYVLNQNISMRRPARANRR